MLKSRNNHPPGGFYFVQPETGWTSSKWRSFDHVVSEIIAHRQANPRFNLPTDKETVAIELENQMTERLRSIPGGMDFLMDSQPAPPGSFQKRLRVSRAGDGAVADRVKNVVAGIGLWKSWFKDQEPIAQELANKRAATCKGCQFNIKGNIFQRFTEASGKELLAIMGSLKERKLTTPHDAELGVCDLCDCATSVKAWTPLNLALEHMRPEVKAKLPPHCWLATESVSS